MPLVLIPVKVRATRANGSFVVGATVRAVLTVAETDDGMVVPDNIVGITNAAGEVTLNLWPNSRGVNGSQYRMEVTGPSLYFSGLISLPEAPSTAWPVELSTLINQPPYPSRSAAETAQLKAQEFMLEAKGARDEALAAIGKVSDYAELRAYQGTAKSVNVTGYMVTTAPSGIAGHFARDDVDVTSADNGGTIIVAANGKRWKRAIDGDIEAAWFGVKGDDLTDSGALINVASAFAYARGGGPVILPAGFVIAETTVHFYDYVLLKGRGEYATTLKLKNGANVDILQKKTGHLGVGTGFVDMTVYGNDANNAVGGIYFAGANDVRGPALTKARVTITACRPSVGGTALGVTAALVTTGNVWGSSVDCDITLNQHASGWVHRGSDWDIKGLFLGPNGALAVLPSMVVERGAGNTIQGYLGGNGGAEQLRISGAQRNKFNIQLDSSWREAVRFVDHDGVASNDNELRGSVTNAGLSAHNTYDAISLEGNASGNDISVKFLGDLAANKARYYVAEKDAATNNYIHGGMTDANYGTGFQNLRTAGTSKISGVKGYSKSQFGTVEVSERVDVQGPFFAGPVTAATPPLLRLNNGGATSLLAGSIGYSAAYLQAQQDDGTNLLKELWLNPLGGGVLVGTSFGSMTDNASALGGAANRWSVVYAGTGTINTSDAREKQQIQDIPDAWLDAWAGVNRRRFKWNEAVARKGEAARWHVGLVAQDVHAAFAARGIDAFEIGLLCYDEWSDEFDEVIEVGPGGELRPTGERTLVRPAGNRWGVRYDEAQAMEAAWVRRELARLLGAVL